MTQRKRTTALKGLWHAFDEATFGADRTLNLRDSLPTGAEACARAEAWLRTRQVTKQGEVLIITGRGNQSPGGVGVVRDAVLKLMPSLRRRGIIQGWREHSPGSVVVTLAPVTTMLDAPRRQRDRHHHSGEIAIATPQSLAALPQDIIADLRTLATRNIETLGVRDTIRFVSDEMQRIFETLNQTLPVSADREGALRRVIRTALQELDG